MPQYAQYDPTVAAPSPVIGWYDTDVLNYPNLPAAANLLELTAPQWAEHFANPSAWAVSGGQLVGYTPPPPVLTPAQQAAAAYSAAITGGLTVTSASMPALNGTYAIDAGKQSDIATEAQFISTFQEFTTGLTTDLPWTLYDGVSLVVFPTMPSFLAFAKVAAQTVAAAKVALAQLAAMPSFTVTMP